MVKDKRLRKIISIIAIAMCLLMIFCGCSKKEKDPVPEETEEVAEEAYSLYGDESLGIDAKADEELRDYRSILVAGIDNGNRADIMMVVCINETSNDIKVFTVTRDAYMQIADGDTVTLYDQEFEFHRCNEAYSAGDKYALMKELNKHLDLNIREFIGVDWATTAKFVDALGGVECDIESQSMLDAINSLISGWSDGDQTLIENTGVQTLSGWQAVHYLRVRKYDGGNPQIREKRNREMLEDMFNKAKGMSMEEISEVYDEIAGDLDTNMSRNTLTDTLALIATSNINDAGGWPYEFKVKYEPGRQFVYRVPDSLYSNVIQLHAKVFDQPGYLPSITVQELSDILDDRAENYLEN